MSRATECPVMMSNGNVYLSVSHEDSVLSCIHGWQRMARKHKVLRQVVGNMYVKVKSHGSCGPT